MTDQELKDFLTGRVQAIEEKQVNENLDNSNGLLLHVIPNQLSDERLVNWSEREQSNRPKRAFRRFSDSGIVFQDYEDGYLGYTPDREYVYWLDNGIIETYVSLMVIENNLAKNADWVKVENLLRHTYNFVNASMEVYKNIYNFSPPVQFLITLIGMKGIYFQSIEKNYTTTAPFPNKTLRFTPFEFVTLDESVIKKFMFDQIHGDLAGNLSAVR